MWQNPQETVETKSVVTFTEEILNGKLLRSAKKQAKIIKCWISTLHQIRSSLWSVFSGIWSEYRDLLHKSSYSVQIRENTDQKKTPYMDTFYAVLK